MKVANFSKFVVSFSILVLLGTSMLVAQETSNFMQPFSVDEHTVLLMHFDGDLVNEVTGDTASTTGGIANFGAPTTDFGNSMYIDNSGAGGSQIIVEHYDSLNLDSSYTIEGWLYIADNTTEGDEGSGGWWKRQPHVFAKVEPRDLSSDEGYDYGMRFFEPDFQLQAQCGVGYDGADDAEEEHQITSSEGVVQLQTWYHFAIINDYKHKTAAFLIFDAEGNLIEKNIDDNDYAIANPDYGNYHNSEPLYFGTQDTHGDGNWFDGALDEFRISNGIRSDYEQYFTPVIGSINVNEFLNTGNDQNAKAGEEITVETSLLQIGNTPIDEVNLHYSTDGGESFTSVAMEYTLTDADGAWYEGTIPAQSTAPSQVFYYLEATSASGTTYSPSQAPTEEDYNSIGIWESKVQTLSIDFDDGSVGQTVSSLVDQSAYNHPITVLGEPNLKYSDEVPATIGSGLSVAMNLDPLEADTAGIRIADPTPFINGEGMEGWTFDFWFKPDSIVGQDPWQIARATGLVRCWYNDGDLRANFTTFHSTYGLKLRKTVSNDSLQGKWWHWRCGATRDYAWWEMRDENDELVWKITESPGSDDTLNVYSDSDFGLPDEDREERQFHGWIDDVNFYNYPYMIAPTILGAPSADNKLAGEDVEVEVNVSHPGSEITNAELHYNVGSGWQTASMTGMGEDLFVGSIPGQPAGSLADFYITVEADNGLTTMSPTGAEENEDYYMAGWWADSSMTLSADFETNVPDGPPVDDSDYGHEFIVHGDDLVYSDEAMVGSYSLNLRGHSCLEVNPAPFITGSSFTVDTWIRPDSTYSNGAHDRIAVKQDINGDDKDGTFYLRFTGGGTILRGVVNQVELDGSLDDVRLEMDSAVVMGNWYHAIMTADVDTVSLQLRDANDSLIQEVGDDIDYPIYTDAGRFVLGADEIELDHPFYGAVDAFKFYNYARTDEDTATSALEDDIRLPKKVTLSQNYPNPFNPTTKIKYTLPIQQNVKITIYDLLGRKVDVLVNKNVRAGKHTVKWDGKNEHGNEISSGVYFYHLQTDNKNLVKKMILLR